MVTIFWHFSFSESGQTMLPLWPIECGESEAMPTFRAQTFMTDNLQAPSLTALALGSQSSCKKCDYRPPCSNKSNEDKGPAGWDAVHKKEWPRVTHAPDLWGKSHPERDPSRPRCPGWSHMNQRWITQLNPFQIPDLRNCEQNKWLLIIFKSFLFEIISDLEKKLSK